MSQKYRQSSFNPYERKKCALFSANYSNSSFSETLQTSYNTGRKVWLSSSARYWLAKRSWEKGNSVVKQYACRWVDSDVCKHTVNLLFDLTLSADSFCRCPVCSNTRVFSLRQVSPIGTHPENRDTPCFHAHKLTLQGTERTQPLNFLLWKAICNSTYHSIR